MASAGVSKNIPDIGGVTEGVNDDDGGNIRDTHKRDPLYYYYSMYSGNAYSVHNFHHW